MVLAGTYLLRYGSTISVHSRPARMFSHPEICVPQHYSIWLPQHHSCWRASFFAFCPGGRPAIYTIYIPYISLIYSIYIYNYMHIWRAARNVKTTPANNCGYLVCIEEGDLHYVFSVCVVHRQCGIIFLIVWSFSSSDLLMFSSSDLLIDFDCINRNDQIDWTHQSDWTDWIDRTDWMVQVHRCIPFRWCISIFCMLSGISPFALDLYSLCPLLVVF